MKPVRPVARMPDPGVPASPPATPGSRRLVRPRPVRRAGSTALESTTPIRAPGSRAQPAHPAPGPATAFAVALLDEFVRAGVRDVVVAPGSRSQALALAAAEFERAGLLRLHVRIDERGAAFLALGLAVESGHPSIVVTTSGTAVANLHPAVLEAHHAGVPLVVLTADRPAELRGIRSNQTTMQPGIFAGAVRLERDIAAPEGAAGESDAAARLARDAVGRRARVRWQRRVRRTPRTGAGAREPATARAAVVAVAPAESLRWSRSARRTSRWSSSARTKEDAYRDPPPPTRLAHTAPSSSPARAPSSSPVRAPAPRPRSSPAPAGGRSSPRSRAAPTSGRTSSSPTANCCANRASATRCSGRWCSGIRRCRARFRRSCSATTSRPSPWRRRASSGSTRAGACAGSSGRCRCWDIRRPPTSAPGWAAGCTRVARSWRRGSPSRSRSPAGSTRPVTCRTSPRSAST